MRVYMRCHHRKQDLRGICDPAVSGSIDRANGAHPRVSLQLESRINFLLTSTSPNSSLKQESEINSWLISAKFVKNSSLQLYTIFINANTMNN